MALFGHFGQILGGRRSLEVDSFCYIEFGEKANVGYKYWGLGYFLCGLKLLYVIFA